MAPPGRWEGGFGEGHHTGDPDPAARRGERLGACAEARDGERLQVPAEGGEQRREARGVGQRRSVTWVDGGRFQSEHVNANAWRNDGVFGAGWHWRLGRESGCKHSVCHWLCQCE